MGRFHTVGARAEKQQAQKGYGQFLGVFKHGRIIAPWLQVPSSGCTNMRRAQPPDLERESRPAVDQNDSGID